MDLVFGWVIVYSYDFCDVCYLCFDCDCDCEIEFDRVKVIVTD